MMFSIPTATDNSLKIDDASVRVISVLDAEMAKRLLSRLHPHQRPIKKRHLADLVRAHKAGKFLNTGAPIRLDRLGRLADGQHRLHMVVETGIPLRNIIVVTIDDDEALSFIDQHGASRGIRDAAGFLGVKLPHNTVVGAILLERHNFNASAYAPLTMVERTEMIMNDSIAPLLAHVHDKSDRALRLCNVGSLSACASVLRVNPEEGSEFFIAAFTGADDVPARAPYTRAIHTYLSQEKMGAYRGSGRVVAMHARGNQVLTADRIVRIWNLYRKGEPFKRLALSKDGKVALPCA